MKRLAALLLTLVLLPACIVDAMALSYDLSFVREQDWAYEVSVEAEKDIAFITSEAFFSIKDLSFTHKYESDDYYSHLYNDLIIIDYFKETNYPVWRLWVTYNGKQGVYANSVSFLFNGSKYTFTGVASSDRITTKENGDISEDLMIKFGTDNTDFIVALEEYYNQLTADTEDTLNAVLQNADVRMILHGIEDLEVQLPATFMIDFFLIKTAFLNGGESVSDYFSMASDPASLKITSID